MDLTSLPYSSNRLSGRLIRPSCQYRAPSSHRQNPPSPPSLSNNPAPMPQMISNLMPRLQWLHREALISKTRQPSLCKILSHQTNKKSPRMKQKLQKPRRPNSSLRNLQRTANRLMIPPKRTNLQPSRWRLPTLQRRKSQPRISLPNYSFSHRSL